MDTKDKWIKPIIKKVMAISFLCFLGMLLMPSMKAKAVPAGTYGAVWVSGDTSASGVKGCGGASDWRGQLHPQGTHFRTVAADMQVSVSSTAISFSGLMHAGGDYSGEPHSMSASCNVPGSTVTYGDHFGNWGGQDCVRFYCTVPISVLQPNKTYSITASVSHSGKPGGYGDCSIGSQSVSCSISFKLVQYISFAQTLYSDIDNSGNTVSTTASAVLSQSWKFQRKGVNDDTWEDVISVPAFGVTSYLESGYNVATSGTNMGASYTVDFPFTADTEEKYYRFVIYSENNYQGLQATSNTFLVRKIDCSVDISEVILDPSGTKVQQYTKDNVDYEEMLNTISITATVQGALKPDGIFWQYRNDEDPTSVWTNLTDTTYHLVDNSKYSASTMSGVSKLTLKSPGVDANLRYRAAFNYSRGTVYSEEFGYTTLVTPKIMRILVQDKNGETTKVKKVVWQGKEVTRVYFGLPEDAASKRDHIVYGY